MIDPWKWRGRGASDRTCDTRAKAEALYLVEPLMSQATREAGGSDARLLVGIACAILQKMVSVVFHQGGDVNNALEVIASWSLSVAEHTDLEAVRNELEKLLHKCGPEKKSLLMENSEAATVKLVRDLVSAALFLDPEWIALQAPEQSELFPRAGASTAYFICYHEAAEVQSRATRRPFREIQSVFTNGIIRPMLDAAENASAAELAAPASRGSSTNIEVSNQPTA
jgi:hypothetical protein